MGVGIGTGRRGSELVSPDTDHAEHEGAVGLFRRFRIAPCGILNIPSPGPTTEWVRFRSGYPRKPNPRPYRTISYYDWKFGFVSQLSFFVVGAMTFGRSGAPSASPISQGDGPIMQSN